MKIGVFDGSIVFASGTIHRGQDRSNFLATQLGRTATEELVNPAGDWRHISLAPESGLGATLIYQGERLHQVLIAMDMPPERTDIWTREYEFERKSKHDAWLRAELGTPPYDYAWGRIDSEFDEKGFASEIIVTYAS
jgi:hypothetical protein